MSGQGIPSAFTAPKAGMSAESVAAVTGLLAAGTNNPYTLRKVEKKEHNTQKVEAYTQEIQRVLADHKERDHLFKLYSQRLSEIESYRSISAHWIHVDLDMFFVAVEIRDRPDLAEKPVAVGTTIVSTSNYIARKFGVRSAMPTHLAKQLCPGLILLKGHFEKYREASHLFMQVLEEYDAGYESGGLDEAKIEVSEYFAAAGREATKEAVEELMAEIRERVKEEIGITASCGYAGNTLLAKICSDVNKPDGQYYLPREKEKVEEFLEKLDVRKIPGIGPQTEDILKGLGIDTVGKLRLRLFDLFIVLREKKMFSDLAMKSMGVGRTVHKEKTERKSFNISKTIKPTQSKSLLLNNVETMCKTLAQKLVDKKRKCKNVRVRLKFQDFKEYDKSQTLGEYTSDPDLLYQTAAELFSKIQIYMDVRLVGVSVSELVDEESAESKNKANQPSKENSLLNSWLNSNSAIPSKTEAKDGRDTSGGPSATNIPAKFSTANELLKERESQLEAQMNRELDELEFLFDNEPSSGSVQKLRRSELEPIPDSPSNMINISGFQFVVKTVKISNSDSKPGQIQPEVSNSAHKAKDTKITSWFTKSSEPLSNSAPAKQQQNPDSADCPVCGQKVRIFGSQIRFSRHVESCLELNQSKPVDAPGTLDIELSPSKQG